MPIKSAANNDSKNNLARSALFFYIATTVIYMLLPFQNFALYELLKTSRTWNWWEAIIFFLIIFVSIFSSLRLKKRASNFVVRLFVAIFTLVNFHYFITHRDSFLLIEILPALLFLSSLILGLVPFTRSSIFPIIILAIAALHAQLGILQFVLQKDVGFTLLGESIIDPSMAGVAKFSADGNKLVRAYGAFSHPNTFAGALVILSYPALLSYGRRLNQHKEIVPLIVLFGIITFGIIVSFSRAAFIAYLLALLWQYFMFPTHSLARKTLGVVLIFCLAFSPLLYSRVTDPEDAAATERIESATWANMLVRETNIITGIGLGNYTKHLKDSLDSKGISYEQWQIAPLHFIPALAIIELGILLTAVITIFILSLTGARIIYLVPLVPLLIFDHYLYTSVAAAAYLGLLIGFIKNVPLRLPDIFS